MARGIVMVLIAPDGRAVANATSFETSTPGGFSLRQAQELRAQRALAAAAINAFCSPVIAEAMDEFDREEVLRALVSRKGYRIETIAVGHDDEEAA
jgi:hypothetical protein